MWEQWRVGGQETFNSMQPEFRGAPLLLAMLCGALFVFYCLLKNRAVDDATIQGIAPHPTCSTLMTTSSLSRLYISSEELWGHLFELV